MDEKALLEKSQQLLLIKQQINQLTAEAEQIKQELMPAIKAHGAVKLDSGQIYYRESKGALRFSRAEVLKYLSEAYGDTLAEQVDRDCTKQGEPKQLIYVQLKS